jgi:RND family efflux transporter MFP subunit
MSNVECRKKDEARSPKHHSGCSSFRLQASGFIRHSSFVIAVAALLAGCSKPHEPAPHAAASLPAASVRTEAIQLRKLPLTEEVVGTVRPKQAVEIEAKISGRITALPVALGQTVKEGELLVSIAAQEVEARLEQAQAASRQAETDFNRVSKLQQTGAATQSELDAATNRKLGASAAVAEAEAMLSFARITSPISGVVARKDAETGDLAMPGKPLLRLENPANLRLEADVPASVLGRVKIGDAMAVRIEAAGAELQGKVVEISPVADPSTRSVRVKLDLPETKGLLPGQFGRLAVPTAETELLLVPPGALVRRGQLDLLFVSREGKVQMRIVRVGPTRTEGVEILAGLNAGEAVVVEGATALTDGQPLQNR